MPLLIDSYSESNFALERLTGDFGGALDGEAQSFVSNGGYLASAKFWARNINATASVYSKLYSSVANVPTTLLATSDAVDPTTWDGTLSLRTFNFSGANQYAMSDGTEYFIAIEHDEGTLEIGIGTDNTSPTHSGTGYELFSAVWTSRSYDVIFYVYKLGDEFSLSDSLTLTENVNVSLQNNLSLSDSISVSESTTETLFSDISSVETLSLTESLSLFSQADIVIIDSITITETVVGDRQSNIDVFSSVSLTELVSTDGPLSSLSVYDGVTITEDATVVIVVAGVFSVNLSDTLAMTESKQLELQAVVNVFDSLSSTESITTLLESYVNTSDSLTLSENLGDSLLITVNVSDSIILAENFSEGLFLSDISVFDAISLEEPVTMILAYFVTVFDIIILTEDLNNTTPDIGLIASSPITTISISEGVTVERFRISAGRSPLGRKRRSL